ncbi:MAG TPA: NADAR family protein, partial [Isosphaeraceae bacterium]|nr:NADAR family protein [Isosphaeraceae bacterium]
EACREPVVIWSKSPDLAAQQIGNFAPTPFELDGQRYASVESFWQSLKFQEPADRLRVASLEGAEAKRAGTSQGYGATVMYEGQTILVGTWAHWNLMERACRAKFAQNQAARAALLGTGQRPLVHRVRQDSQTIPAVILAEIWMRIRKEFFDEASGA